MDNPLVSPELGTLCWSIVFLGLCLGVYFIIRKLKK